MRMFQKMSRKTALACVVGFMIFTTNSLIIAQEKPVIAVVDFKSLGVEEYMGQGVAELLRTDLRFSFSTDKGPRTTDDLFLFNL